MSLWPKENVLLQLRHGSTGLPDTDEHSVKLQPLEQTYPNGAVNCIRASGDPSFWLPETDLDTESHYDVYVDDLRKRRMFSPDSQPPIV